MRGAIPCVSALRSRVLKRLVKSPAAGEAALWRLSMFMEDPDLIAPNVNLPFLCLDLTGQ